MFLCVLCGSFSSKRKVKDLEERLNKEQIRNLSFEDAFNRLNDMAGRLEHGNLSLEDSLELYEQGVLLSQQCDSLLNNAQLRVQQIGQDSLHNWR